MKIQSLSGASSGVSNKMLHNLPPGVAASMIPQYMMAGAAGAGTHSFIHSWYIIYTSIDADVFILDVNGSLLEM